MSDSSLFSGHFLAGWGVVAALTFGISLGFLSEGDNPATRPDKAGSSTFSRSAIGFAGFAEMLRLLQITVVQSRADSLAKVGQGSVLVVAAPPTTENALSIVRQMLQGTATVLVLPKWRGQPDLTSPDKIKAVQLLPQEEVERVLALVDPKAQVVRPGSADIMPINQLSGPPTLGAPQLVRSTVFRPLIANSDGMLVGYMRRGEREMVLVADPDIISNHGLAMGYNADIALAVINWSRKDGDMVVFDETSHGYVSRPTHPAMMLFQFPFLLVTGQVVLAMLLLIWAGIGRFGAALPLPPPLAQGSHGLISDIAGLLEYGRHHRSVIRRYLDAMAEVTGRRLYAERWEPVGRLFRAGKAGPAKLHCAEADRIFKDAGSDGQNEGRRLLLAAQAAHQWKEELLHGCRGGFSDRRGDTWRGAEGGGGAGTHH